MSQNIISGAEIDNLYHSLKSFEDRGYFLNPEIDFTKGLIKGLLINQARYGYQLCPCRLTGGSRAKDLDIICPCDYRDADVSDYDTCYCGLYVSQKVVSGRKNISPIPERRPINKLTEKYGK